MTTANGLAAQQILSDLNGVTFNQTGQLASDESAGGYGHNAAGYYADVTTNLTTSTYVQVDYADKALNSTVTGYSTQVTGETYAYTAATATNLATFGTITLSHALNGTGATASATYYVHGFSNDALLLSKSATLTVDEVNGVGASGGNYTGVTILSNAALYIGPTSPYESEPAVQTGTVTNAVAPNGFYFNTYASYAKYSVIDGAGIGHGAHYTFYRGTYHGHYYGGNPNAYTNDEVNAIGNGTFPASAPSNPNPPTYPLNFTNDATQYDVSTIPAVACFAEGVRVLTARGEVLVEDLLEGDEVVTASGGLRPVIWIGSRRMTVAGYPVPEEVNPIRIRAGAFGEGVPSRDLRLSPGHAVFVDGVLVPAGHLVNGATVIQEAVDSVRYFHIELDAHDVMLAEGLPCESYLDDGNRDVFANAPEHTALYGRLDPVDWDGACAPVLRGWETDAQALTALKARLHARAEAMGWTVTTAPDLTLLADGQTLAPLHAVGDRLWFLAPRGEVALTSRAARPFDVIPGRLDTRRLGVAVGAVRVDGQPLDLEDAAFGAGFMAVERHGDSAWRWTDGAARLTLPAGEGPALLELRLTMTAPAWTRPAARLKLVKAG